MICFVGMDIYFIFNGTTKHSLNYILGLFDIDLDWLPIDHLNGFQLIFRSNILILHLKMQLYLLVLYLFILDCNRIKSYRYIDEILQPVVAIGLLESCCITITHLNNLIHNLHEYTVDSYIIHAGKTAPIIKKRDKTKMEENNTDIDINSIINNQLFSVLLNFYVIFLGILIYYNLFPIYGAKNACLNSRSIVIKKSINMILQNIMEYLHNGWHNLFGLLKRNCINILIIFMVFSNIQVISYLIIMGEYNLMYFIHAIVFVVNGDIKQIVLLQKNIKSDKKLLENMDSTIVLEKTFRMIYLLFIVYIIINGMIVIT